MTRPDHVVELKPQLENSFSCPECHAAQPIVKDVLIQPGCELADCQCRKCGVAFYQTFPVGHTLNERVSVSKPSRKLYATGPNASWLSTLLMNACQLVENEKVDIKRKIFKPTKNVVILNTLDFLYGHVLLKLFNAECHLGQQKNFGLIIIVPRGFEWLIPTGCAEAWIVNLKLSQLDRGYRAIQQFIVNQNEHYDRIYLSKAYSHPDVSKIDLARFTGVRPFNLQHFRELKPTITFVLREDRWWFSTVLDYWTYRLCRRFKIQSLGNRLLAIRQNRLVKKTIRQIQKKLPYVDCVIVGLGKTGKFGKLAKDLRQKEINSTVEGEWCRLYARSHVIVGVHGSNMLLPTGLAAGCVEILPADRYSNIVQDIAVRYNDRRQLFFYRFAEQYVRPASIAEKVVSIVSDFESFNLNMGVKPHAKSSLKTVADIATMI